MANKKKLIVLTITMMLAVVVSTAIVSFSLAGGTLADSEKNSKKAQNQNIETLASAENLADALTNIDHIIDKAHDANLSDEDRNFRIVQIVSNGKKETSFKKYVNDGLFVKHVIEANKSATQAKNMPQERVKIDVFTVADLKAMVDAEKKDYGKISSADLIYISNDPADPFYIDPSSNISNDIPTDIYNVLHVYSDDKPIIIDYSTGKTDTKNQYSMENLATNVLQYNFIKYNTYKWKSGVTLLNFLNRKESVFLPYSNNVENYAGKVLVVYGDTSANTMYTSIKASLDAKDDVFLKNAYYRKAVLPTSVTVSQMSYTQITDASFADEYDFVFIENDTYGSMTQGIYNAISSVSLARKHLIYPAEMISTGTTDTGSDTNYGTLLGLLVSPEGMAYSSNVYVSNYTFFDSMVADPVGTQEAANEIAELLKASTYREFGKDSASGKKYTVLEIQPAYPIDLEMAKANNSYYTNPGSVYKQSKEMTPDGAEYYAFEMTLEKIMAFTGLTADKIDLVQISTEELQGMKTSIADKYDLVYIGGNTSAMTPTDKTWVNGGSQRLDWLIDKGFAYYEMFSHTGAVGPLKNGGYGNQFGDVAVMGGNDITRTNLASLKAYVDAGMPIIISDDVTDAYTALATMKDNVYKNTEIDPDSNMFEFLSYVLEDYSATAAADGTVATPTYTVKTTKKNVLAGFDKDDIIRVPNLEGTYGKTLTSYAVIFNDGVTVPEQVKNATGGWDDYEGTENPNAANAANTAGAKITSLIASAGNRPTMNLSKMPKLYIANTPSSYLDSPKLSFDFELLTNGNNDIKKFVVTLYIDDNANGLYTDKGEDVKTVEVTVANGKAVGAFTYELSPDFYGPVSWKIEAVSVMQSGTTTVAGPSISYAGVSKVARLNQEKELVHILQIMPPYDTNQSPNTLYFCPTCQLSNTIAKYDPYFDSGTTPSDSDYKFLLYERYLPSPTNGTPELVSDEENGHYLRGLHRHSFGIWSYDKSIEYDDWTSNLAEDIMGADGDFEFAIDIYSPATLDSMNAKYSSNAVAALQLDKEAAQEALQVVQNEYNDLIAIQKTIQDKLDVLKKEYTDLEAAGATATELAEKLIAIDTVEAELDEATINVTNKEPALEAAKAKVTNAKKVEKELTDSILAKAAVIYEEYENALAVEKSFEHDLRNVLMYFRDHKADIEAHLAKNGKRISDLKITDYDVFAEVLESEMYYVLFSDARTQWRNDDGTDVQWNLGRFENKDFMITFDAVDYEGNTKTYKIGTEGVLKNVYKKNADGTRTEITVAEYEAAGGSLDRLDHENYEFYYDYSTVKDYSVIGYYYQLWADAKSATVLLENEYWEQVRSAHGKDWLKEVYSIIILGASEDFGENMYDVADSTAASLKEYEADGGNMLLFHDTMTKYQDKGSKKLTAALREQFGLDRFHMTIDGESYKVNAGYDSDKYFMTVLDVNNPAKMVSANLNNWGFKRTMVGATTTAVVYNRVKGSGDGTDSPYAYASVLWSQAQFWARDARQFFNQVQAGNFGTNRATQLNSGIITSYPYSIGEKLNITGTHNQYFALDVEDDEVITWYTLAGGYTKTKEAQAKNHSGSSIYTASPGDAQDSYFIYTKGNTTYCGAGHSKVVGPLTDNNDERMLFINVICNSARKNALKPSIKIYDPDNKKVVPSTGNKYIKQNSNGEPYIEVSSQSELIKFGFMATVDTKATSKITQTRIFFRYEENGKMVDEVVQKYPSSAGGEALTSGVEYYVNTNDKSSNKLSDSIKLKPEYFEGYDDCAYLYIEVTDSNGEVLLEKIRIDYVRDLFDMT